MPDGRLHGGARGDIVADGRVEEAFRGEAIRFRAEERTFRLLSGGRGEAVVRGRGLHAALAAAVLEREGFAVVAHRPAALTISADCAPGWKASFGDRLVQGKRFADLAAFVRGLPTHQWRDPDMSASGFLIHVVSGLAGPARPPGGGPTSVSSSALWLSSRDATLPRRRIVSTS